jgi:hypothetical protein
VKITASTLSAKEVATKFTKLDEQNYTIDPVGTIEMKDNKVIVLVD